VGDGGVLKRKKCIITWIDWGTVPVRQRRFMGIDQDKLCLSF
jgi:hypothetical protein